MVVRRGLASFSCQTHTTETPRGCSSSIRDGYQPFLQLKVGFYMSQPFLVVKADCLWLYALLLLFMDPYCMLLHGCIGILCCRWWLRIVCSDEKQQQLGEWRQLSQDENCKVFHSSAVSVFGGDHPRQWTVMTSLASVMEIDVVFKILSAEWTEVCEFYLVTVIIRFVIFVSYSAILFFF